MTSLFIVLLVEKCTAKVIGIRFRMASFSKMSILTCPCSRRKRVEKPQAILGSLALMAFRSSISTGKFEQLLCLMWFFFSVSLSLERLVYARENYLTYNSIRFKKPLDIFLTANTKKTFQRIFSHDFGCKEKALSDFLASSSS